MRYCMLWGVQKTKSFPDFRRYFDKNTCPAVKTYTHATDGAPDHAGWAFEMKWPSGGIGVVAELAEIGVLDLVADKGARNADLIATDDDDLLAGKELLGNDRGKATKKVVAAVDNDSLRHLD